MVLAAGLLCSACTSSRITNLTPAAQTRNSSGLYPVEAAWESNQQSLRPESIKPSVLIGLETYPMTQTPIVKNRWETVIPVPADKDSIRYRFKFDYDYNGVPAVRKQSVLSQEYKLEIKPK
jgi:hypothetical protein